MIVKYRGQKVILTDAGVGLVYKHMIDGQSISKPLIGEIADEIGFFIKLPVCFKGAIGDDAYEWLLVPERDYNPQ